MSQAGVLVEIDNCRLGIGAKLRGRGPEGIGGLQRMPSLQAALTTVAPADVDIELAMDGLAWDLDLILLLNVGFLDGTAAIRTALRQGSLIGFVDLLGRRRRPMPLVAVVIPGLAAGLLGLFLERAFGEGGSLALAGPTLGFEKLKQALSLGFEFIDPPTQCQTSVTEPFLHTEQASKRRVSQLRQFVGIFAA